MTDAPVSTMKPMRWPSIRPSVWKWPRASRGMLRLRVLACATVSVPAVFREAVLASAGVPAVILSAICAMKVPRPTMKAAKIIRLRITPHSTGEPGDITTPATKPRLTAAAKAAILAKRMSEVLTGASSSPLPAKAG